MKGHIINLAWRRCVYVLALAALPLISETASQEVAAPLELGTAVVDITPPIGYRMSGYFYERLSTGVSNPLQAKVFVLRQGSQQLAWVFCDLVGIPAAVSSKVRDDAAAATGIPREHILLAATHTHTGPLYFGVLRDYYHHQATQKFGRDRQEPNDYPAELAETLTAAIQAAAKNAVAAELHARVAEQTGLAFNRRYVKRDGSVATNPGKLNPDVIKPAGPVDPEVAMLLFRRGEEAAAGLTVFALHCDTTGGTEFAADFPFFIERNLKRQFGETYISAFAAGACGDVNHIDVSHDRPQKGPEESERIGARLAATVAGAVPKLASIDEVRLAAAARVVSVPLQKFSASEVADARAKLDKVGTRELPMLEQVAAVKTVGVADYGVDALPMEVQAFRLSRSVALVALPGELFVELGLAIKQQSPFATTIVVELANDNPGYIPTRPAFAEGSYEPTNSKIEPGGGELLVNAAVELLEQLRGAVD
jgi:neutral ceramidase